MQRHRKLSQYYATKDGYIWSHYVNYSKKLKFHTCRGGYKSFWAAGKWHSVSRFVWTQYNGKIPKGMEINHINGNKSNNNLFNLELMTREQNQQHAFNTGLQIPLKGSECAAAKLQEEDIFHIRDAYKRGTKQTKLAILYGVKQSTIQAITSRKTWKHID